MTLTVEDLPILIDLLGQAPDVRARLRAMLDLDALDSMPGRLDRIEQVVERLALAQEQAVVRLEGVEDRLARAEARLEGVEDRLARVEARLEGVEDRLARLEATVEKLVDGLIAMRQATDSLVDWQRGEEGRRAGEAYERQILRRAANLFNFGDGGSPATSDVARHLRGLLQSHPLAGVLSAEQDPFLADVIWWKGNHYAVTEVSVKVDNHDIKRAARRAETLRNANIDVIPVVIGEDWVSLLDRQEAQKLAVEWKVGDELSAGLVEYRKLAA